MNVHPCVVSSNFPTFQPWLRLWSLHALDSCYHGSDKEHFWLFVRDFCLLPKRSARPRVSTDFFACLSASTSILRHLMMMTTAAALVRHLAPDLIAL